jgi:hypothetical protein
VQQSPQPHLLSSTTATAVAKNCRENIFEKLEKIGNLPSINEPTECSEVKRLLYMTRCTTRPSRGSNVRC